MSPDIIAIVPAAGLGSRFGANKPLVALGGRPLLAWALRALEDYPAVREIVPVVKSGDARAVLDIAREWGISKVTRTAPGGRERQDSVLSGLRLIDGFNGIVLIHDGVRPFLSAEIIDRCISGIEGADGAVAAMPPKDTIKSVDDHGIVIETLRRDTLRAVQTPQVFRYKTIRDAYERAALEGFYSTDDSALLERTGGKVRLVEGAYTNIKLTTAEDMDVAEGILRRLQG